MIQPQHFGAARRNRAPQALADAQYRDVGVRRIETVTAS